MLNGVMLNVVMLSVAAPVYSHATVIELEEEKKEQTK
jgi:hypothetical protein